MKRTSGCSAATRFVEGAASSGHRSLRAKIEALDWLNNPTESIPTPSRCVTCALLMRGGKAPRRFTGSIEASDGLCDLPGERFERRAQFLFDLGRTLLGGDTHVEDVDGTAGSDDGNR